MSYNGFGQLASKRVEDPAGLNILSQLYQRSLTGSIQTKETDAGTWSYLYDLTGQLTNALLSAAGLDDQEWGYAYDPMGNRLESSQNCSGGSQNRSYAPNNLNQYTAISTVIDTAPFVESLLYDLNGNLTNDGVRAYTWDLQNQLVNVDPLMFTNGSLRVEYAYDAFGRRISKKVSRLKTGNWEFETQRYFFYDSWNLVKELITDSSDQSSMTKSYTWGNDLSGSLQGAGGVGGLLCSVRSQSGSSEAFYPLYDHNGNIEKYITGNGAVVAEFQYDGFGKTISESVASGLSSHDFSYRFSTKQWDAEVDLYYYGYRYYSPEKGRWVKRDPIGEKDGGNRYCFIKNSGVDSFDFLGLALSPQCQDAVNRAIKQAAFFFEILSKYDPISDAVPHFTRDFKGPAGYGQRVKWKLTKPGGHHQKLKDAQQGVRNRLVEVYEKCKDDCDKDKKEIPFGWLGEGAYKRFAPPLSTQFWAGIPNELLDGIETTGYALIITGGTVLTGGLLLEYLGAAGLAGAAGGGTLIYITN